jgi:hypothetical protein
VTDPDADMDRIESTKGTLLKDCYAWILDDHHLRYWQNNGDCRLLWMNGDPGKGKTMLMIALVHELRERASSESATLAFFFCQSTEPTLNNVDSVLRGLTWKLVHKDPQLAQDLLEEYRARGKSLFDGPNTTSKICLILSKILNNPALPKVYILIDAVDECDTGRDQLLEFITKNTADPSSRAKWLLSSRNYLKIQEILNPQDDRRILNLELNSSHVSQAVNTFIDYKSNKLARRKKYANALRLEVNRQFKEKARLTFLWAALVFKELEFVESWDVLDVLEEMPLGLEPLYNRMMQQIQQLQPKDPEFCRRILSTMAVAHRPLHLLELGALSGLPERICNDFDKIVRLVNKCGSFLTIREDCSYFIHQSARDFLLGQAFDKVFPSGIVKVNYTLFSRSLQAMSETLRQNIYMLDYPGTLISDIKPRNPDLLIAVQYSCVSWVKHFLSSRDQVSDSKNELSDNGTILAFFQCHFLHWLEALSLIGGLSECTSMTDDLLRVADVSCLGISSICIY